MIGGRAVLVSLLAAIVLAVLILAGPGIELLALGGAVTGFGLALAVTLSIDRRMPLALGAVAAFLLTFLVLMPIGCSGGEGEATICSNLLRVRMPGFSGGAGAFTPSYWPPGIAAALVALAMYFSVRRRAKD